MLRNAPIRSLATLTALTLALVACGGGDDDTTGDTLADVEPPATETTTTEVPTVATAAPETAPPATEPPPTEPPATEPPATEPPATEPPVTEAPEPDDGSCLEGSYLIDSEQLNGYYNALAANSGAGLTMSADGVVNVSFFDGAYQYAADFVLSLEVAGTSGTGTATGNVNGNYTVEDNVILADNETSSLDIQITVAGVTIDGSDLGNDLITSAPINGAPFTCDGGVVTLLFQSGPTPDVRHPVVLTPF
ncbi:MAG: hypothetical protein ACE37B_17585 [Ilumatobacter sp.]|jgi:hypothetical protein|uniref:hypothetical protein n=1 Tax=Ilumatobacter sp. TaxID=1967498 RepID=UPI0039196113